jgi:alkane 1-monooxygenase
MKKQDFKYLFAYTMPLTGIAGLYFGGWASFGAVFFAFVLIPLMEACIHASTDNHENEGERTDIRVFDYLLYLHLPILYVIIFYALYQFQFQGFTTLEIIGNTLSIGVLVGAFGINIAHELGHRNKKYEQWLAQALLLPALYMHFFVEHNRGHHKNVATDLDPASARKGENLYAFWWRSVVGSYRSAWAIEASDLARAEKKFWHFDNQMLRFQVYQIIYLAAIALFFSVAAMGLAIGFAVIGFLLLETINYIEHYGLRRKQLPSGKYEAVAPCHSWNANQEVGRIFLYELTRHADHHYKATRPYQILRHHDEAPTLPSGYPASMLLALLPPLWFRVMNPRVERAIAAG